VLGDGVDRGGASAHGTGGVDRGGALAYGTGGGDRGGASAPVMGGGVDRGGASAHGTGGREQADRSAPAAAGGGIVRAPAPTQVPAVAGGPAERGTGSSNGRLVSAPKGSSRAPASGSRSGRPTHTQHVVTLLHSAPDGTTLSAGDAVDAAISAPPTPHTAPPTTFAVEADMRHGSQPAMNSDPSATLHVRPAGTSASSHAGSIQRFGTAGGNDDSAGMGASAEAALDDAVAASLRLIRAKSAHRHTSAPATAASESTGPGVQHVAIAGPAHLRGVGGGGGGGGSTRGGGMAAVATPAVAAGAAVVRSTRAVSVEEMDTGGDGHAIEVTAASPPTLSVPELSLLHASALRGFRGYAEQHAARVAIATARGSSGYPAGSHDGGTPASSAPTSPLSGARSPMASGSRRGSPGPQIRTLPLSSMGGGGGGNGSYASSLRREAPEGDVRGGVAYPPTHSPIRLSPSPVNTATPSLPPSELSSPGPALRALSGGTGRAGGGVVSRVGGGGVGGGGGVSADPSAVARSFRRALHPPALGHGGADV